MAATRGATPPPVIGKAGRYTVFITPPPTPRLSEGERSQSPSPSPSLSRSPAASPKLGSKNVAPVPSNVSRSLSSIPREKMRSSLSAEEGAKGVGKLSAVAAAAAPPVQVPPPQFEKVKGGKSSESVFGFFWNAVAKVQDGNFLRILLRF